MSYGQKLPFVNSAQVVLMGKSAGGFASLALAAQQPAGLRGVINFAGGRGSQPRMREKAEVCGEAQLLKTIAGFAATSRCLSYGFMPKTIATSARRWCARWPKAIGPQARA